MPHWSLTARAWWIVPVFGFILWGVRIDNLRAKYKAERDAVSLEYTEYQADVRAASAVALARQKEQIASIEKSYQEKALAAESQARTLRSDYRAVVMRYAKANGNSCGPITTAENNNPRISESPTAATGAPERITISLDEALLAADLYAYALGAYTWANGLREE